LKTAEGFLCEGDNMVDFGSKVLKELIDAFEKMTTKEYLELYERAKREELDTRIIIDHAELFFDNE
jgi:hypothetical protein